MKRLLPLIFFISFAHLPLFSQSISGVINIYTPVTAINNTSCIPSITVLSSAGFSVGDTVLIIQMKGAQIDTSNTAVFGTINSYGDCGNYEFSRIAAIAGNVITLQYSLLRTYTLTQYVQLIRVPVYNNANITGTLSAQSWNLAAGTGGVLAFIDKGTTTFNADIDVRNDGFQGAPAQASPGWVSCSINYIEPNSGIESLKGESIAILGNNYTKGSGSPANGGGGGITDNGGGGASNFGAGGLGGQMGWMASCNVRAQGGKPLTYNNTFNKIFLGGAGGDSQRSEGVGPNMGVNGGGIVIIRTAAITGNNFSILAQGANAPPTVQDGGGGGGAGGTVLLDCPTYTGNLNINTSGGNGGDANIYLITPCSSGAGGGGGALWVSTAAVPASIVYTSIGGLGGVGLSAVHGDPGSSGGSLTNLLIPQSTLSGNIAFSTTPVNILCNGQNNGSATANPSAGTAPFTYSWSNGQTTSAVSGLSAGSYTVTVTDNAGCVGTATLQITQPPVLTSSVSVTGSACTPSGSATVSAAGGTGAYTYSWSNGQSSQTVSGLTSGTYTVTVADANGCTGVQTASIGSSSAITSSVTTTNTSCGNSTGTAAVSASGGTGAFTYSWSGGQTTPTATGLAAGTYTCITTDAAGCTKVDVATVANSNGPSIIASATNVLCNGGSNGTAAAAVAGGSAPYTYLWNPTAAATTATATGLTAGTYTVIVTDAGGCSNSQTVTVTQPLPMLATTLSIADTCGQGVGSAGVIASNGTAPYAYLWNNGQSSQIATGLAAGTYTVTVTDVNGCTITSVTSVGNVTSITVSAGANATIQYGSSVILNASGGVSYSWSPATGLSNASVANPTASPTVTTLYCVQVTDANGCSDSSCVLVFVLPEPVVCGEFYIPNAFSPNGDNENEVFKAYIHPDCVSEFTLVIYNRWGEVVFETDDVVKGWDGNYRNKLSNTAVYTFYCQAILANGKEIIRKGNVSLVR